VESPVAAFQRARPGKRQIVRIARVTGAHQLRQPLSLTGG
jgi:hypothetical protein